MCDTHPRPDQIQKLEKQGWSQTKIARWLAEKSRAAKRIEEAARQPSSEALDEAKAWDAFFRRLLASGPTARIGILLHFYEAELETEVVDLSTRRTVGLQQLNPDFLMRLERDVFYEFVG